MQEKMSPSPKKALAAYEKNTVSNEYGYEYKAAQDPSHSKGEVERDSEEDYSPHFPLKPSGGSSTKPLAAPEGGLTGGVAQRRDIQSPSYEYTARGRSVSGGNTNPNTVKQTMLLDKELQYSPHHLQTKQHNTSPFKGISVYSPSSRGIRSKEEVFAAVLSKLLRFNHLAQLTTGFKRFKAFCKQKNIQQYITISMLFQIYNIF